MMKFNNPCHAPDDPFDGGGSPMQEGPGPNHDGEWARNLDPSLGAQQLVALCLARAQKALTGQTNLALIEDQGAQGGTEKSRELSNLWQAALRVKYFLGALQKQFEHAGINEDPTTVAQRQLRQTITNLNPNPITQQIFALFRGMEVEFRRLIPHGTDGSLLKIPRNFSETLGTILTELQPYMTQSDFCYLASDRVRGPGNNEAIERIISESPSGSTLLGYLLDQVFLAADVAEAVRERTRLLPRLYAKIFENHPPGETFNLVSFGRGTAGIDLGDFLADLNRSEAHRGRLSDVQLVLADHTAEGNLATLERLHKALPRLGRPGTKLPQQFTWTVEMISAGWTLYNSGTVVGESPLPRGHCTSCVGWFDYDPQLPLTLTSLAHATKPGGYIIFTYLKPGNPDRFVQASSLGWSPLHRTDDQVRGDLTRMKGICKRLPRPIPFEAVELPLRSPGELVSAVGAGDFAFGAYALIPLNDAMGLAVLRIGNH